MAKRKKVDFNLASEIFDEASLTDNEEFLKTNSKEISNVNIKSLLINPHQPRIGIDPIAIKDLSISIEEYGILQPITVLKNDSDTFIIVFGHRRVAACELLGHATIPAYILDTLDNKELVIAPLIENLQRQDMEPIETSIALSSVLKLGIISTQLELSNSLGISQGRISKLLSVSKLEENVLKLIKKIKYRDVTVLAALNKIDSVEQYNIFLKISNLSREDALKIIKNFNIGSTVVAKRVVKGNNRIVINTKNIPNDIKFEVTKYLEKIENLLNGIE